MAIKPPPDKSSNVLSAIANGTGDLIAAIDTGFRFIYFNDAYRKEYQKLWETEIGEGTNLLEGIHDWPEEREKARTIWQRALDGETYSIRMEFGPTPSETRYYDLRFNPIRDDAGGIIGAAHILSDVTAQVMAEKHRELLIRELNHRVKNTLAVVQAVARRTFTESHLEREIFEGRLSNIASAHDMLSNTHWEYTSMAQIVETTLQGAGIPKARYRTDKKGDVILSPEQAVSMSMALHELATNSLKYGAWSNDAGMVDIFWERQDGDQPSYTMTWQEEGGPDVQPPEKTGFGVMMIREALSHELGGDVELTFDQKGLCCSVTAPLSPRRSGA